MFIWENKETFFLDPESIDNNLIQMSWINNKIYLIWLISYFLKYDIHYKLIDYNVN